MYENIGHFCQYFEQDEFTNKVQNISNKFSTYSHNVRSLPGKWTEIVWLSSGHSQFQFMTRHADKLKFLLNDPLRVESWYRGLCVYESLLLYFSCDTSSG